MPFDRIQGLHLVKLDGSKTKYDIFFEVPSKGILLETVQFKYESTCDELIPDKILVEAGSISSRVVFNEG